MKHNPQTAHYEFHITPVTQPNCNADNNDVCLSTMIPACCTARPRVSSYYSVFSERNQHAEYTNVITVLIRFDSS